MFRSIRKSAIVLASVTLLLRNVQSKSIFDTKESPRCKNDCIDEFFYFCPSADGKSGTCCDSKKGCSAVSFEDFSTGYTGSYCSFDSSDDSIALKYWSCPRSESICGPKVMLVPEEEESEISSNPDKESNLVNG